MIKNEQIMATYSMPLVPLQCATKEAPEQPGLLVAWRFSVAMEI
jgi:hypothetical protein